MSVNVIEGEIVGLNPTDVEYSLLVSVFGETKRGKTFFGASFPNAVVIDFPPVKMKFGSAKIDEVAITRSVGEGFRSLFSSVRKDGAIKWIPKIAGFDFKNQYKFVKSWQDFQGAIEHARLYSEGLDDDAGKVWVVLDDTNRWRGLEVINWSAKNGGKWPAAVQFGQITQQMQAEITDIQEFANVLLISRMVKNFDTGDYGPQVYPSGSDYLADASLEIWMGVKDNKQVQIIKVHSNGHDFECNPTYCKEIVNPTPIDVLASLRIPRELW
jgi:hypothetical protein